jgi:hypothetical protein
MLWGWFAGLAPLKTRGSEDVADPLFCSIASRFLKPRHQIQRTTALGHSRISLSTATREFDIMAGKGIGCLAEAMGALRVSAKVC